jgi:hypothetical protein
MKMITIAVTGIGSEQIAHLAEQAAAGQVQTTRGSDFDAALAVKSGTADFYIGACQTGAGGALGVATALLGANKVARLTGPNATDPQALAALLAGGTRAFGLAHTHIDVVVPALVQSMLHFVPSNQG